MATIRLNGRLTDGMCTAPTHHTRDITRKCKQGSVHIIVIGNESCSDIHACHTEWQPSACIVAAQTANARVRQSMRGQIASFWQHARDINREYNQRSVHSVLIGDESCCEFQVHHTDWQPPPHKVDDNLIDTLHVHDPDAPSRARTDCTMPEISPENTIREASTVSEAGMSTALELRLVIKTQAGAVAPLRLHHRSAAEQTACTLARHTVL
jgi:hypothetical protein